MIDNNKHPCGYVEKNGESHHLTMMGCSAFKEYKSDGFNIKINVGGINSSLRKYRLSFGRTVEEKAEILKTVENMEHGDITLTELIKKHGGTEWDIFIAVHDYREYYRLFVHKS